MEDTFFFISIAHWSVEEGGAIIGKVAKRQRQNPRQKWKTAKCAEEQENESIDSFQIIIWGDFFVRNLGASVKLRQY